MVRAIPSGKIQKKKLSCDLSQYNFFLSFLAQGILTISVGTLNYGGKVKCNCLRKCSRGQTLWSTDLAETWHRSWV